MNAKRQYIAPRTEVCDYIHKYGIMWEIGQGSGSEQLGKEGFFDNSFDDHDTWGNKGTNLWDDDE